MGQTIKCKNCGAEIEISEALTHQIEEQVLASLKVQHAKELAVVKSEAESEFKEKNKKILDEMAKMEKTRRELAEKIDRQELEYQKRLNEELEKFKDQAGKMAQEKARDQILIYEKQIEDYKKSLDEANYKLSQRSQQMQGEILELDLEKTLKEAFHDDVITPVSKGAQGADIVQMVIGRSGREAGIILWETKDAKWTPSWLSKLREDGRNQAAKAVVLVSKNLPKEIVSFGYMEGVIITSPVFALGVASLLHRSLREIALAKLTAEQGSEKIEQMMDYIQNGQFLHRFEAFAEGIRNLNEDLESEKRSMERVWKCRETQIKRVSLNISRMYGELQGVMGNALPEIKVLSLPDKKIEETVEEGGE
jgi:hypothetical protein